MKLFLVLLSLTFLCIAEGNPYSNLGSNNNEWKAPVEGRERALDVFILNQLEAFKNNISGNALTEEKSFNYTFTNGIATGTYSGVTVSDIKQFNATIGSNVNTRQLTINLDFQPLQANGSYLLHGVVDSLIIVEGEGPISLRAQGVKWNGVANISIDQYGYASISKIDFLHYYPILSNYTFEGIKGEETIGEFIQPYLKQVGTGILLSVDTQVGDQIEQGFTTFLNNALQTITLEEILNGQTPPPTSTPTPTGPTTGRPPQADVVVDLNADIAGSGWNVISETCSYSAQITGFFCNGSPVPAQGYDDGVGFWMSPCNGDCTFQYINSEMKKLVSLGIKAYYRDSTGLSKISVLVSHVNGNSTRFEFFKSPNVYNQVTLSGYEGDYTVSKIDVTMENNSPGFPPAQYSILDILELSYE